MKNFRLATLLALILSVWLVGCGDLEEVTVTITRIETESTEWGCIGTDKRTFVKTEDNRADFICNEWGKPGDKLAGYWKSGHWDANSNGFRLAN